MWKSIGEEYRHFIAMIKQSIKIRSDKDHQHLLNIGEIFDEQDIYRVLKCLFKIAISWKGNIITTYWRTWKSLD